MARDLVAMLVPPSEAALRRRRRQRRRLALLEAAARPTHFDLALDDEVEADGDFFPGDWQALLR